MDAHAWDKIRKQKKKQKKNQFFQGTITWSVLKKKKTKTFKLKTSIAESASISV